MTATNIYEMAQEWDNGAVDFTAIKMSVTDTASGAGSKLLDLQRNGSRVLGVQSSVHGGVLIGTQGDRFRLAYAGNGMTGGNRGVTLRVVNSALGVMEYSGSSIELWNLTWRSEKHRLETKDYAVDLYANANDVLMQRNGVSPQAFYVANTWTDGSNNELGFMRWNSNVFEIGNSAAGTGTGRSMRISVATGGDLLFAFPGKFDLVMDSSARAIRASAANTVSLGNSTYPLAGIYVGKIYATNLPTADPAVAGQVWNDAGTLKISAG